VSFRTYHEVADGDRSGLAEQIGAQRQRVRDRLAGVGSVVAVMSGKGGVGKSYLTASLAAAAARRAAAGVGVLDADLASPTVARLLDARGPLAIDTGGVRPATGRDGVRVFSSDLLLAEGEPLRWRAEGSEAFAWRGALDAGATREFLADVAWGSLDLLLIDLPPGTDRLSDLATLVPTLAGAIAVTIPSAESQRSVARAIRSARACGVRVLGVIENMSGYACNACGDVGPLFAGDAGAELAATFDLPLIARVPFFPGPPRDETFAHLATRVEALLG
jgi:ATP-binding protein involved in chromosome partitioning